MGCGGEELLDATHCSGPLVIECGPRAKPAGHLWSQREGFVDDTNHQLVCEHLIKCILVHVVCLIFSCVVVKSLLDNLITYFQTVLTIFKCMRYSFILYLCVFFRPGAIWR